MALLVLAVEAGCDVTAVHVDHGLRPGSDTEADVVAATAMRFGAAFISRTAAIAPGPDLEARARAARYAMLPSGVLTGHTADDQAETVLLNLLRGAGLDGLQGMARANRPLLALRRAETRALCVTLSVDFVDDPSNLDPSIRRNRVRHELVPLLEVIAQRDVVPVLVRQTELLRDEAAVLDELAGALDPTDARLLAAAPAALARRAVRSWLRGGTDAECHPPDAATVERVLAVARGETKGTDVGGGRHVTRARGRLVLTGTVRS
jgi:tRNA(Ile)-lysidine synthase